MKPRIIKKKGVFNLGKEPKGTGLVMSKIDIEIREENNLNDWESIIRENVNYDEAELGCNWGIDELINFISSELQRERLETLDRVRDMIDKLYMPVGRKELLEEINSLK